jgi:hypothetical protein
MRLRLTRVDQNSFGQPRSSGRINDPLSFWAQWFFKPAGFIGFHTVTDTLMLHERFSRPQEQLFRRLGSIAGGERNFQAASNLGGEGYPLKVTRNLVFGSVGWQPFHDDAPSGIGHLVLDLAISVGRCDIPYDG